MPNQPKTPNRVVRIHDKLWTDARAAAQANGTTVSQVIRSALTRYVAQERRREPEPPRVWHGDDQEWDA